MSLSLAGEIYVMGVTDDGNPSSVDSSFQIVNGISDSGLNVLSTAGNIQSIDFDDINRVLYWSENAFDAGDEFAIKTYDGTIEDVIIVSPLPGDEDITGIALHPAAGKIYWVIDEQLFRANLNGSGLETIVTKAGLQLMKVAVDKINNRVFVVGKDISVLEGFVWSFDLDGSNELTHMSGVSGFDNITGIDISASLNKIYLNISRTGEIVEIRTRDIAAGVGTLEADFPLIIGGTYPNGSGDIVVDDVLAKFYVTAGIGSGINAIFKQDLDGGTFEEFDNLSLLYKSIALIPCATCERTHVLEPTSTTSSLNFFPTPHQNPTDLHLNVDNLNKSCVPTPETDHITGNEVVSRVKVGFTPPLLSGTDTFFGVSGNICGAFSGPIDTEIRAIGGNLFLEGISLLKLNFNFPAPSPAPDGNVGGFNWFDPDIIDDLAFHEAIITAGLEPATVDWSTLEVQITIESALAPGVSFDLHWVAITLFEKTINPTAFGGATVGGIAQENTFLSIKGGVVASGKALVSGPVVEEGLGGITVLPRHLATSIETRFPISGSIVPATILFVDFVKHFDKFPTDTVCFLSGGSINGNPLLSIGGEASFVEADGDLFDDFQPEESATGLEDYRCIYIFNNVSSTITNLRLWIESSPLSSAAISLGLREENDIQEINLSFLPSGGSFTLDFGGVDIVVDANVALDVFALNFQNALRNNTSLTDVIVQVQQIGTTVNFTVSFIGSDGAREQPTFALLNNGLVGNPTISITKTNVGSPINAIAQSIATDTTTPVAEFKTTTQILPIVVPTLNENEGFPLWIKRTVAINPVATQNDGFLLKIFANPITIA